MKSQDTYTIESNPGNGTITIKISKKFFDNKVVHKGLSETEYNIDELQNDVAEAVMNLEGKLNHYLDRDYITYV